MRSFPPVLSLALAVVAVGTPAAAQFFPPCDSCDGCSTQLAVDHARVELVADLEAPAHGPCLVVRGAQVQLNARGHTVRAHTVGVRVEGTGARVRNLHVQGGQTGIVVASPDAATLYHVTVDHAAVGISVEQSTGARIVRCTVHGGTVGVAFGRPTGGHCAPGTLLVSRSTAVLRSQVDGADIGIAACDALPVLAGNTVTGNGIGVLLGAPRALAHNGEDPGDNTPFDPCLCAPDLAGVHAGTTLLYSSGCSGCEVHEGWLPGLRARGSDIRVRETGPAAAEAGQRYDDFAGRCAPELTDTLGIAGSVPNYGCMVTGTAWKVRVDDTRFETEAVVRGPDDVASFAATCAAAAARRVGGGVCVRTQLWENTLCGNQEADLRAEGGSETGGGADDACGTAPGWTESGHPGCARPCAGLAAAAPVAEVAPPPASAGGSAAAIPEQAAGAPPVTATTADTRRPRDDGAGWGPLALLAGVAAALGLGALALGRVGRR